MRTTNDAATLDAILDLAHPTKVSSAEWAATALGDMSAGFDRSAWSKAAAFGVQGLLVDPAFGGRGGTSVEAMLTFEGLGLGARDHGFVFALASQVFAMQRTLSTFGTDAQKQRWLPGLCAGDAVGAFAMSEPEAGSDTASITTTATPLDGGGWRLDGTKTWVTLGPLSDVAVVFATTDPERGHWGTTAFLVDIAAPGVTRGEVIPKLGLRNCPFGELRFDGCRVGEADVLGKTGSGGSVFTDAVQAERAFLYSVQLGSMERVLDTAIDRARTREQFGTNIGSFQAVSHRVADMKLRHEMARLLVYKAAALHDRGQPIALASALAKLATSELSIESALDSMRLHGAEGYTDAGPVEADLRDAVGGLAYSGTSDVQKNIVARILRVDRPVRRSGAAERAKRSDNED